MKLSAAIALMLSILSHLLNNILMRFLRRLPVTLEEETHQETSLQGRCKFLFCEWQVHAWGFFYLDQQVDSDTSQVSPPVAMKVEPLKPERKRPGELMKKRRRGSQASEGENSSVESNKSQEDADDIHSGKQIPLNSVFCVVNLNLNH